MPSFHRVRRNGQLTDEIVQCETDPCSLHGDQDIHASNIKEAESILETAIQRENASTLHALSKSADSLSHWTPSGEHHAPSDTSKVNGTFHYKSKQDANGQKDWEQWETYATNYLQNASTIDPNDILATDSNWNSDEPLVKVDHMGGADSTVSDIRVTQNWDGKQWFVECKSDNAASGQFMLKPDENDNGRYTYSDTSTVGNTEGIQDVINIINSSQDAVEARRNGEGTSVETFELPPEVAEKCIQDMYGQHKNASYFISPRPLGKSKKDGYTPVIIPTSMVSECYDFRAQVRRKPSGTRHMAKKNVDDAVKTLDRLSSDGEMSYDRTFQTSKGHLMVQGLVDKDGTPVRPNSRGIRLPRSSSDAPQYILTSTTEAGDDCLEVKQASDTNNTTAILYLSLKDKLPEDIEKHNGLDLYRKSIIDSFQSYDGSNESNSGPTAPDGGKDSSRTASAQKESALESNHVTRGLKKKKQ